MQKDGYIAERRLYTVAADGNSFEIALGIGKPYPLSADEWACAVRAAGLHNNLRDMHGVDSWQALQLAHQLAAQLLGHFIEGGGQLFWEKGGEQLAVSDLFPKVTAF